jgi:hypothetical protein
LVAEHPPDRRAGGHLGDAWYVLVVVDDFAADLLSAKPVR